MREKLLRDTNHDTFDKNQVCVDDDHDDGVNDNGDYQGCQDLFGGFDMIYRGQPKVKMDPPKHNDFSQEK